MLIRGQTAILLQIFYEILLCSQVIFKSMKKADDSFQRNSECLWVKVVRSLSSSLYKWVDMLTTYLRESEARGECTGNTGPLGD